MDEVIEIVEVAYHRNGVGGEGFHVLRFTSDGKHMLGIVFPLDEGQTWNGRLAVFDHDLLGDDEIRFGFNSWRGDTYEAALRAGIAAYEAKRSAGLPA